MSLFLHTMAGKEKEVTDIVNAYLEDPQYILIHLTALTVAMSTMDESKNQKPIGTEANELAKKICDENEETEGLTLAMAGLAVAIAAFTTEVTDTLEKYRR